MSTPADTLRARHERRPLVRPDACRQMFGSGRFRDVEAHLADRARELAA